VLILLFASMNQKSFDKIVDKVLCEVNPARLNVAKYPIGMQSRVFKI
jgi:hypothetical protein